VSNDPSSWIVIAEILRRTPVGVWLALAAITVFGALQWRERRVSRTRLLAVPVALAAYSLWATCSAFGVAAAPAWLAGMALVLMAGYAPPSTRTASVDADGRVVMAGSAVPLLAMWALFGLRYVVAVALALHAAWTQGLPAVVGLSLLFGALSGLFAARAWRVLQSARWPGAVSAA
jgi:hypothetical protein